MDFTRSRRVVIALLVAALMLTTAGCGTPSDDDKQSALQEVSRRGFTNAVLAPDRSLDSTVYVYATYKGCRLLFSVNASVVSYEAGGRVMIDDVNVAVLDKVKNGHIKICRDATPLSTPIPTMTPRAT